MFSTSFFSYDDWFIGNTNIRKGIPKTVQKLTKEFNYNDINSLKSLIKKYPDKISCVVLEPATHVCPSIKNNNNDYEKENAKDLQRNVNQTFKRSI